MDSTVLVAGLGMFTTLAAVGLTAHFQRGGQRESRVFEARVASYSALVTALYDFERATYNRVKARLDQRPDAEREQYRQEAWTSNAQVRATIGVVALLSTSRDLHSQFDGIRRSIGDLNSAANQEGLLQAHKSILATLDDALVKAKHELT